MQEIWSVYNKGADFQGIAKKYGIDPVTARVMRNREVVGDEAVAKYLGEENFSGYDGALLKDMDLACEIMIEEMKKGGKIRIISDYDVDGLMSNYVLYKGLCKIYDAVNETEKKVDYVIPHRMKDGYGLNQNLIEDLVKDKITLLITCDNGIAAKEEIALAKSYGIRVIVTDHHEVQGELPKADAIVDPKRDDCQYPFKEICGAVVAYKLIEQLYKKVGIGQEWLQEFQVYIAIATVCDVMKLIDENRFIVKRGLQLLNQQLQEKTVDTGLYALIKQNQLEEKTITATTFGFIIGPCLNATGRLSTAVWGLKLLLEQRETKAQHRAKRLTQMNAIRKQLSATFEKEAYALAEQYNNDKVLVIYLPECHESIAGIVAGRVREKTGKPTIILTKAHEKGMAKGSARSIPEYNIFAHLYEKRALLVHFGGHPMAAGMSLLEKDIESLRSQLNEECTLTEKDIAIKRHIDVVMPVSYISEALIDDLKKLEPHGNGNEKPVFAVRDVTLTGGRILGAKQNVLRLHFITSEGIRISGIYFSSQPLAILEQLEEETGMAIGEKIRTNQAFSCKTNIIYSPSINEYMGKKSVELRLISLKG